MPCRPHGRPHIRPEMNKKYNFSQKRTWSTPKFSGGGAIPDRISLFKVVNYLILTHNRNVPFVIMTLKFTIYALLKLHKANQFILISKEYISDCRKKNPYGKIAWKWLLIHDMIRGLLDLALKLYLNKNLLISCDHRCMKKKVKTISISLCYFGSQSYLYKKHKTIRVLVKYLVVTDESEMRAMGQFWTLGHAFLLVYLNLLLVEEAKAIVGWESIRDLIRVEDHNRSEGASNEDDKETPLKVLSEEQLVMLKDNYESNTPYIRLVFVGMTILSILSDCMLTITIIFWHTMPQKVAGGAIAIISWYLTYRLWFKSEMSPGLPGKGGLFLYQNWKQEKKEKEACKCNRRRSSISKEYKDLGATFMGMPLNPMQKQEEKKKDKEVEKEDDQIEGDPDPVGTASEVRSSARNMSFGPFKGDGRMFGDPSSARTWRR
ncbi:unnamed protein product, partial [Meganyctiphanes norvegica]